MATLTSTKIKNTYDALLKSIDNDAIGTTAKQITDGLGNTTPLYISTTQVGIGVTPESGLNLHVFGDAKIGSNLTVIGNLVVEGSTTTVGTDTLTVKDPLIVLANNNTSTDAVDIGFYGKYTPSSTTLYSGLFREALTGKYRLFKGLETEPTTTVNTSGTGYTRADLVIGNLEATQVDLGDSEKIRLGDSQDLEIYHDGTTGYIVNSRANGDLYFRNEIGSMVFQIQDSGTYTTYINLRSIGEIQINKNTKFIDNVKAEFGDSSDLEIYHDSFNNYIDSKNNGLFLKSANSIRLYNNTERMIQALANGEVSLYYDGSLKLSTTSTGVDIEGILDVSTSILVGSENTSFTDSGITFKTSGSATIAHNTVGESIRFKTSIVSSLDTVALTIQGNSDIVTNRDLLVGGDLFIEDNNKAFFGTGSDLEIYHDGSNSYITDSGTGDLRIQGSNVAIRSTANENMIVANANGAVSLYYDATSRLQTTSTGVNVTGLIQTSGSIDQNGPDNNTFAANILLSNATNPYITISDTTNSHYLTLQALDAASKIDFLSSLIFEYGASNTEAARLNSSGLTITKELTVSGTGQSSFAGQVTVPATPSASTDAASKGYVDSQVGANNELSEVLANGNTSGANNIIMADDQTINFGDGSDLTIKYNSVSNFGTINNKSGHLYIQNEADNQDIIFRSDDGSGGITTYFKLDGSLVNGTTTLGAVNFPDKSKIFMGAGSDLRIYHDGTDSYLDNTTGDFYITNYADDKDIKFLSDDGAGGVATYFELDGSATLLKAYKDLKYLDNVKALFGDSSDLQIYHDGSNSYIDDAGTGNLLINANNLRLRDTSGNPYLLGNTGAEVRLYYSGSTKLQTTSTGVDITGAINADDYISIEGATNPYLRIQDTTNEEYLNLYSSDNESAIVYTQDTFKISSGVDFLNQTPRLTINSSGNATFEGRVRANNWFQGADGSNTLYSNASAGTIIQTQGATANNNDSKIFFRNVNTTVTHTFDTNNGNSTFTGTVTAPEFSANVNNVAALRMKSTTSTIGYGVTNANLVTWSLGGVHPSGYYFRTTGANPAMQIIANGNVGIGTTSPLQKLHLAESGATSVQLEFSNTNLTKNSYLGINGSGHLILQTNELITFNTGASYTERMRIDSSGNVGIGTTLPTQKLDVDGSVRIDDVLYLDRIGGAANIKGTGEGHIVIDPLDLSHNVYLSHYVSGNVLLANGGGNVGIGTTSPNGKLTIKSSGFGTAYNDYDALYIDNGSITAGNGNYGNGIGFSRLGSPTYKKAAIIPVQGTTDEDNLGLAFFTSPNGGFADVVEEAMRINYNGKVGIGTTSPTSPLTIKSNSTSSSASGLAIQANGNTNNIFELAEKSGDGARLQMMDAGVTKIALYTDGTANYINAGNVGIGTTSPSFATGGGLQITNATQANLRFTDTSASTFVTDLALSNDDFYIINRAASGQLKFRVNASTEAMTIDSNGNVGIGTTAPAYKLDVNSSAYVGARIESTADGYAPASILLESGNSNSRGQGIYQYNSVSKNSWFSGVPYNTTSDDWIIAHKLETTAFNSDVAQMSNALFCVNDNGNVGIGSTNPATKFVVQHTDGGSGIEFSMGANLNYIQSYNRATSDYIALKFDAEDIRFGTNNGTERMRIDSSGNVGIGTTSPGYKLTVNGDVDVNNGAILAAQAYGINLGVSGYDIVMPTTTRIAIKTSSSERVSILNNGNVGIGIDSPQSKLHIGETATIGSNFTTAVNNSQLFVHNVGANTNSNVIFAGGDTGASGGTGAYSFGQNGQGYTHWIFYHKPISTNQSSVGSISSTSTATSYNTSSDYRLKENVVQMTGALDRVSQLKPSRFNFIADENTTVDGFLAHEVQDIVPEAITGEKDAVDEDNNAIYQGIDQSKLVPLLVGAIQELKAEIEQLKTQINK